MKASVLPNLFDLPLEDGDAGPNAAAVHFQFRFAGTARADAAAET